MREIKFRGYNAKNQQWLYGFYLQNRGRHFVCPDEFANGKSWEDYEAIPETVGQFTGLLDKNGTEIYEGDIVRVDISRCDHRIKNRQYMNDKVEWYQYKFVLSKADINVNMTYRIEVIGNIHDNPELIKGGEK